jgi:hypothetical protein
MHLRLICGQQRDFCFHFSICYIDRFSFLAKSGRLPLSVTSVAVSGGKGLEVRGEKGRGREMRRGEEEGKTRRKRRMEGRQRKSRREDVERERVNRE